MPLDTSMYAMLNHGVTPIQGPMELASQAAQLQNLRGQGQMQQMQMGQLQRQIQDANELRETLRGSNSFDESVAKAQSLGTPAAQNFLKSAFEMKQRGVQLNAEQFKLANEHLQKVGQDLIGAANSPGMTPQALAGIIQNHVKQGNIPPTQGMEMIGSIPTDPSQLPTWGNLQAAKVGVAPEVLKLFTGDTKLQDTGNGFTPVTTNQMTGAVRVGKQAVEKDIPPSDIAKALKTYNDALPDGQEVGATDPKFIAWWHQMHPNMALMMGPGSGGNANPSQPLSDPGMEAIAQAIARGDQAPQDYSIRNPAGKVINARAAMIAQDNGGQLQGKSQVAAKAAGIKDFEPQGNAGKTIVALNTMTEHLATARRLADALNNGDLPLANKIGQSIGVQLGDNQATNFNTLKQFLAGEVAKVATGGHLTEGEIHSAADRLNSAQSPAQLKGALDVMNEVAGGKLVALNQDYKRLTGKTLADAGRLTPATQKAFQSADSHISGGGTKQLSQSDIGKLPPAVADAYLSGKAIKGPDGTIYQKGK